MNTYLLNSHNPLYVHLIDHKGIDEQVTGRLEFSSEPQHLAKYHDMSANALHYCRINLSQQALLILLITIVLSLLLYYLLLFLTCMLIHDTSEE